MSITVSCYVSGCTVSVALSSRVIRLSQWFITVIYLCLWLYCISITKKSDTSITVIYHAMSLATVSVSVEWYVYHGDLSCYVSGCTVSVSLSRVICLLIYHGMTVLYSITKQSDMSITVIYHAMSLTVLYQYH